MHTSRYSCEVARSCGSLHEARVTYGAVSAAAAHCEAQGSPINQKEHHQKEYAQSQGTTRVQVPSKRNDPNLRRCGIRTGESCGNNIGDVWKGWYALTVMATMSIAYRVVPQVIQFVVSPVPPRHIELPYAPLHKK